MKRIFYVQPKELSHELNSKEVITNRKLDCIFYNICLDTTSARNWKSFTCIYCNCFIKNENPRDDLEGCIKLIKEIEEKPTKHKLKIKDKKNG